MIAVIRISGQCKIEKTKKETLKRLNLDKKFSCVVIDEKNPVLMGMVHSVSNCVVYGDISSELIKEIEKKREKNKKGVFHLHPPRGGFKKSSKVAYPKGILGENKEISKLIERML